MLLGFTAGALSAAANSGERATIGTSEPLACKGIAVVSLVGTCLPASLIPSALPSDSVKGARCAALGDTDVSNVGLSAIAASI